MKLIISRDQKAKKGLLGGHKGISFTLSCRIEFTPEENDLIKKYKMEDYTLTYTNDNLPKETVRSLMGGITEEIEDVGILLNNEEVKKSACKDFKVLLDVMATFGGQEVIEI